MHTTFKLDLIVKLKKTKTIRDIKHTQRHTITFPKPQLLFKHPSCFFNERSNTKEVYVYAYFIYTNNIFCFVFYALHML